MHDWTRTYPAGNIHVMARSAGVQDSSPGARLRAIRRARGFTQRTLARRTGLAEPFLSRLENGRAHPSLQTVERLARGLDVTITDLLGAPPRSFTPTCPVSQSGRCIAELIYRPAGRMEVPAEGYTPQQIRLLRLSNHLVQFGTPEALAAFETVLSGLLKLPGTRGDRRRLRAMTRDRPPRQSRKG
jgi:transcriptional regulator with XRE-family HTH domain